MTTMLAGGRRIEFTWHGPRPDVAPTLVFLHDGIGCAATWRDFPARRSPPRQDAAPSSTAAPDTAVPIPSRFRDRSPTCTTRDSSPFRTFSTPPASAGPFSSGTATAAPSPCCTPRRRDPCRGSAACCSRRRTSSARRSPSAPSGGPRDEYLHTDLRGKLERYHGGNVDCAFWGWNRAWLDPGFLAWNIEDCLPAVTVPVLVAQGIDDPYGSLRQVEAIERQCGGPVRRCILERCGHSPHREQRERTLSAMAAFVCGISDGSIR